MMDEGNKPIHVECSKEFSYEIALVIPYCYYWFKKGRLGKTNSTEGTESLYWFAKRHRAKWIRRKDPGTPIPSANKTLYCKDLDWSEWLAPPYREQFKNSVFVYDKPMLIIHNKYAFYGKKDKQILTLDYININTLDALFNAFRDKYQIVYIRPNGNETGYVNDKNKIREFGDFDLIKTKYPDIITIQQLMDIDYNKSLYKSAPDYNTIQLMLHANCENSISASSGATLLACMFGGNHVVYEASKGYLRTNGAYDEDGYVTKMTGTKVKCAKEYGEFVEICMSLF